MRELLARGVRFDAVFGLNDTLALGAMRVLQEAGRRVPEDVAVVGFDDHPWMSLLDPPLTTVSQPMYDLGITAAELLIDKVEGRVDGNQQKVLPTTFVHRESCGC